MQILVENLNGLERKIKVSIPNSKIDDMVATKIKKSSKQIKLNGFRPGHVPMKLIEQKYGSSIRQEIISEMIDSALDQAMKENNLAPIGDVKLDKFSDRKEEGSTDHNLYCEFLLEVYPEVDFKDFAGLQLTTPVVHLTDQDVEKSLLVLRKEMSKKVTVDRPIVSGDIVIVDFNGTVEDQEFPGGTAEDFSIEIGSNLFIDGFEEGLIGSSSGTVKELKLSFPDDYPEKSLAGKPVNFKINIKQVQEKQLAEIGQDLAKKLNVEDGDVSKIHSKVLSNMQDYVKKLVQEKERAQLIELLLSNYPVDLPERLVNQEKSRLKAACIKNYQDQGILIKELNEKVVKEIFTQANNNVHLSLLLRSIIKNYDLKLDEKLLKNQLKEVDTLFGKLKNINNTYKKLVSNLKNSIIDSTLTELSLNFVKTKVNKVEEPYSFEQLTNKD